ncbi:MAG: GNAT family N-acetyltransferase [Promethearchaeia archaeon]
MSTSEIVEEISDKDFYLRKISQKDAQFFLESLQESNTVKYLSLGPLKNLKKTHNLIRGYLYQWEKHKQFNYIIEKRIDNEQYVKLGSTSLWNISWNHKRADIGIWLNLSHQNKGYGKKAIDLLKIIAFIHLKLHRLQAYVANPNKNSLNLFKRCNFTEEAILHDYLFFNNQFHDATLFSLLDSQYLRK